MTHTYAFLDVSPECIAEIRDKLVKAGYEHAIQHHDQIVVIDMYGIALREEQLPDDGKEKLIEKVRGFVKSHASIRRKSVYQNSHEANVAFSPAYDLLKQVADAEEA